VERQVQAAQVVKLAQAEAVVHLVLLVPVVQADHLVQAETLAAADQAV
jgi:hypothetical protein